MRIISDIHDYYDCLQKHDTDRTTIYFRKPEEDHPKKPDGNRKPNVFHAIVTEGPGNRYEYGLGEFGIGFDPLTIGFCGKAYRYLKVRRTFAAYPNEFVYPEVVCWNTDAVMTFVRHNLLRNKRRFDDKREKATVANLDRYFTVSPEANAAIAKVQEERRSPILAAYYWHTVFNARLKPFEFYRVLSPAIAYAQLTTWFCNQAPPMKPIPKMSDEVMAHTKGYDKHSFRKDKAKRR